MTVKDKFTGCLLAGACGDALGYPVEFMTAREIRRHFGKEGIKDMTLSAIYREAQISDDTQMTLFTVNGLLAAVDKAAQNGSADWVKDGLWPAYKRWYHLQMGVVNYPGVLQPFPFEDPKNYIVNLPVPSDNMAIRACRAPGNTCLAGLSGATPGEVGRPKNDSKGNGGVMRVAPVGLLLHDAPGEAYTVGRRSAAITHGHPTGYIAAGVMAYIVAELVNGRDLLEAVRRALRCADMVDKGKTFETVTALENALAAAERGADVQAFIASTKGGWIAEEALAIALFCALRTENAEAAIRAAVNHGGDSDTTGAICGNIVGARDGVDAIPARWLERLELRRFITGSALDLYDASLEDLNVEEVIPF